MKMSSCVFQGSVLPMSWKIEVILGTTTTMSTPMMIVPSTTMMIG